MRIIKNGRLPLLVVLLTHCIGYGAWKHVDFDDSMKTKNSSRSIAITKQVVGIDGTQLLDFFRKLYNKNNFSNVSPGDTVKIPKIFHFIWLGSPVPEVAKKYIATWVAHHPEGWEFKLWTDEEVKSFPLYNQDYYDQTTNYGVRSDLLKWEVVYKFGGVYVDIDFECLQPLDRLHVMYDFYTALQPLDTQYVQLGAALFAATPGHPILKHCIETIKDDWCKQGAPARSGPIHFTKSFFAVAGKGDTIDVAFPASYFYPLGCMEKIFERDKWIINGAYGVHHWAKSWMPSQYRAAEFKTINNDHLVQNWNDIGERIN